jgi:hypothetical protein
VVRWVRRLPFHLQGQVSLEVRQNQPDQAGQPRRERLPAPLHRDLLLGPPLPVVRLGRQDRVHLVCLGARLAPRLQVHLADLAHLGDQPDPEDRPALVGPEGQPGPAPSLNTTPLQ